MIDKLEYYYNLTKPYIIKYKNKKYVKSGNEIYLLYQLGGEINKQEIIEAYELTKIYPEYEKIILNKSNSIFTVIDKKTYILIKKKSLKKYINTNRMIMRKTKFLDKSNWISLWENKIDYIETIYKNIKGKYIIIDESIDYFIGMAETSIYYLQNNLSESDEKNIKYICRKNYDELEYYSPLNIIIDYPEREISEMLKKIFFENENYYEKAIKYLKRTKINYNPTKVYARLLFPNYYFNEYINSIKHQDFRKVLNIINRMNEYEIFLKSIYNIIREKDFKLKEITWL